MNMMMGSLVNGCELRRFGGGLLRGPKCLVSFRIPFQSIQRGVSMGHCWKYEKMDNCYLTD